MTNGAPDAKLEQGLQRTAQQISDAGLPIKVAVIGNKTDLGAVPQLWGKPQVYAKFLGAELRFVYKDTLLVVMPQGLGVSGPYVDAPNNEARALAALAGIDPRADATPQGLTATADKALRALAKADGTSVGERRRGRRRLPLPLIAAGVMVLAGIGGGVLILRGERKPRARLRAGRPGVSASPGGGRSLQSTSTAGGPSARAPCSPSSGSCGPERARDRDGMAVALAVAGADEPGGPVGGDSHAPDRLGRQRRAVGEHDDRSRAGRVERGEARAQRRCHAALPALVAHGPRAVQIDRGEHVVAVGAEHDHAVAERRRRERGERPLHERPSVDGREHLDAAAGRAEARAGARREQHAADHPGPRPPPTRSPRRAKRP